jgi:hypothetical protein
LVKIEFEETDFMREEDKLEAFKSQQVEPSNQGDAPDPNL